MMILLYFTCQYIDTTAEIFIRKEKLVILTNVERARALECKCTWIAPTPPRGPFIFLSIVAKPLGT